MNRVRRLLRLPPPDRRLLVRTALLLTAVRLGLTLLPFRVVQRAVARAGAVRGAPVPVERLAWAVAVASRHVPRATCLTRALVGQALLARHGHAARLRIGVARDDGGRFEAHAWVEDERGPIIGAPEPGRFTPLPAPPSPKR